MTDDNAHSARFAPEAFFASAAERLHASAAREVSGDHILNPSMAAQARYRDAAVLIPILERSPLTVLFTLRTPRLAAHAGQVSFPGGKIDPGDATPAAAALREAEEEIGLDPRAISVLGDLPPYLTGTGFRVVPVVARVAPPPTFRINHDEVAEIFEVPLAFLLSRANMHRRTRVLGGRERVFYELEYGGHMIWGATAGMIVSLTDRILG